MRCGAREHSVGGADVLDEPPLLPIEVAVIARLLKANRHLGALEVRGLGPNDASDPAAKTGTNDVLFDAVEGHAQSMFKSY